MIQLSNRYLSIYLEYTYLFFIGFFGLCKLKTFNFNQLLYVRSNIYFSNLHWLCRAIAFSRYCSRGTSNLSSTNISVVLNTFSTFRSLISSITFRLFSFVKTIFKLNGIGYRIFFSNNFYFFKLGYSHLILNYLELFSFFARRKLKFLIIHGLFSPVHSLYQVLHYRKINVYTGKGIMTLNNSKLFKKKSYKK